MIGNIQRAFILAVIIEGALFLNFIIAEIMGFGPHSIYGMMSSLTQAVGIIMAQGFLF